MAFARAVTALATLEEKLRRSLGLAGEIGAKFEPVLTPVLIAGDLREAGNSSNVGRSFTWCYGAANFVGWGANQYQSLRVEVDVLVTHIMLTQGAGAGAMQCYVTVPGVTPAVAVATLAGTWCDRKLITGDQVPLTQGAAGALTGTDFSDQTRICGIHGGPYCTQFAVNVMLAAGSHLNFRSTSAGGAAAGIFGRIWP